MKPAEISRKGRQELAKPVCVDVVRASAEIKESKGGIFL
jgi:hypothetical protein